MRLTATTLFLAALLLAAVTAAQTIYVAGPSNQVITYSDFSQWTSGTYDVCGAVWTKKYDLSSVSSTAYLFASLVPRVAVIDGRCYRTSIYPDSNGVVSLVMMNSFAKIAYVILINTKTGQVNITALPYTSFVLYTNSTTSYVGVKFYTANAVALFWKAFGGGSGAAGNSTFVYAPMGTQLTVMNGNTALAAMSSFPALAILVNATWTEIKYSDVFGNVFTAARPNDAYIFTTGKMFIYSQASQPTTTTTNTQATTTTTPITTTPATATSTAPSPGQPIGTTGPTQWQVQRPDGTSATVAYGQATLYSQRVYVFLYDVWGNPVTDASVTCGSVRAQFNQTNLLYYCDGITSTTTVTVSHPKYYSVKFQADPGKVYVVMLYPSTSGVPNEPTPQSNTQAYLVLQNPSPQTVQAQVQAPSGCVFNVQVGSTALNTYTLQPYSSLLVTVSGPSSGCDSGEVAVLANGKKVWSATWGSIKGTTQYVNVASDIKYPVSVYGVSGQYLGNVTGMPAGGLFSGNWMQWVLIIGAAFIILMLLAIVLSRR